MTETPLLGMAETVSAKSRLATSANSNPQVQLISAISAATAGATSPLLLFVMTATPTTTMAVTLCAQWSQVGNAQEEPLQQLILVGICEVMARLKALIPQLTATMAIIATTTGAALLAQLKLNGSDQEEEQIQQALVQTYEVTDSK